MSFGISPITFNPFGWKLSKVMVIKPNLVKISMCRKKFNLGVN